MHKAVWFGNPKERDHLKDLVVERVFKKWGVGEYVRLIDLTLDRNKRCAVVYAVMNGERLE
jgi:hypothetical protein